MSARMELHVALSLRLDAKEAYRLAHNYRDEVLAEADLLPKADVVAWLTKKAREGTPVEVLASKVERGAVRPDNLRMLPADFFEPGHTYTRQHHASTIRFLVQHVDWSPCGTYKVAFGWRVEDGDVTWSPTDSDDFGGWVDVTQGGESE
ncbi:hypothetical protein F8R89_30750 [Streptomyces sp. SS1-1]|uniref:hypothetical protein n=1 Tax=Streptomyces sp. SS1-1 TaxID=2651869 RepID=UPI00124F79AC|nr:hypothetical protein [Streptomyces sp. SS1-1]KAB2975989.1 hypothetical protein F8R89_30750 [Streptomyces sp. SS1-1]